VDNIRRKVPVIPATFFGMVLGLAGLGSAWRAAHQVWQLPEVVGEAIMLAAAIVWVLLVILYALKWIAARDAALAEVSHPVQCCFVILVAAGTVRRAAQGRLIAAPIAVQTGSLQKRSAA
jgi:tellurite resistance protein